MPRDENPYTDRGSGTDACDAYTQMVRSILTEASLACGEVPEGAGGAARYRPEAVPAVLPGTVPVCGARYSGFWWCFRNFRACAVAAGGAAAAAADERACVGH